MAPRRRLVLIAFVALVVAAVVVAAVVGVVRRRAGAGPAVDQARQGTVLLVAGYGGDRASLAPLAAALRRAGRTALVIPVAGDGTGDLAGQAHELDVAARAAIRGGAPSVDVVGYSAGGVVVRVWLAGAGAHVRARRVVTLGSPHHGTDLAGQAAGLAPSACPTACRQLAPGSDLLSGLPSTPGSPTWTSVWSETDEVVTPPRAASTLAGAVGVDLQAVCPGVTLAHGDLPSSDLGVGVVDAVLDGRVLSLAPAPSRCGGLTARGRALLGR